MLDLAADADVFLTSYLPASRRKLGFDADAVRARREDVIYVCGSGWSARGPMRDSGGFDLAAGWASSGLAYRLTPPGGEPPMQPPAFFDLQGSTALTAAISTALFRRERTGQGGVVDVSLLNVGMWTIGPDIVGAPYAGSMPVANRHEQGNPLTNWYPTKDGRWLYLVLLQADRYWAELCAFIGAPELVIDERFGDMATRYQHRAECVDALTEVFLTRTLDEWKQALDGFSGVWAPVQSAVEVHEHSQVEANGLLPRVHTAEGVDFALVGVPMQFDGGRRCRPARRPRWGRHRRGARAGLRRRPHRRAAGEGRAGLSPGVLKYEVADRVAVLTLNRPERHNAFSDELEAALDAAVADAVADDRVRALLLRGEGRSFCSGRDTAELGRRPDGVSDLEFIENVQASRVRMRESPKPVVAACKGAVFGAGLEVALAADFRVARRRHPDGLPGGALRDHDRHRRGAVRGRAGRPSRAKYLVMTGERIDAATALAWGLVDFVVPSGELDERATALARTLAAKPPLAVRLAKRTIDGFYAELVRTGMREELLAQCALFTSADYAEAKRARRDGDTPDYVGR